MSTNSKQQPEPQPQSNSTDKPPKILPSQAPLINQQNTDKLEFNENTDGSVTFIFDIDENGNITGQSE